MAANVESDSLHSTTNIDASWLWLLMIGYSISMLMLGLAGILRKRRR
jgi:LPXTG-motif cell wall-anchored protein